MCTNQFLPINVLTFWAFQIFSVCLPTVIYMTYVVHKKKAIEDAKKGRGWKISSANGLIPALTPRLSGRTCESNGRLHIKTPLPEKLKKSSFFNWDRPIGSKIDSKGDPIFELAALFFVIIVKFIFTSISDIKIHEKNSLTPKKFIFEGHKSKWDSRVHFDSLGNI